MPDSDIEPVRLNEMAEIPDRWSFVPHGEGDLHE